MKLHRLEMTAFGPFGGTEEIEFEKLDEAGLFLLTGATGSGKTSVLDAICFALYGLVPRSDNSKPDVASHYRSETARPSVTLELTMGERRLRVQRTPEYERPKKTGSGTTPESQTVTVEQRTAEGSEWQLISSGWSEANRELKDMLGMDLSQFSQVVMLPQGSFARFLRADVRHRRELLNHLFPSQKMDYVERWLKERAKADLAAKEQKEQQIRSQLDKAAGRVSGLLGEDDQPLAEYPHESRRTEVLAWAGTVSGLLEADRAAAARAESASATRLKDAVEEHDRLVRLAGLVVRRAEAEDRLKDLESRASEREALARAIGQAEKAAGVRGLVESFESRQRKSQEASEEAAMLITRLEADPEVESTENGELVRMRHDLASKVAILSSFQENELSRRTELQERLSIIETSLTESVSLRDEAAKAAETGPAQLVALNDELQNAVSAKAGLGDTRRLSAESAERLKA
ncbi:MAG: SMC family ATPase, partial [Actinomycetota bacterium]|nr:SMC family ATPase [Actinomycetota bacterium]